MLTAIMLLLVCLWSKATLVLQGMRGCGQICAAGSSNRPPLFCPERSMVIHSSEDWPSDKRSKIRATAWHSQQKAKQASPSSKGCEAVKLSKIASSIRVLLELVW